jgi:endonuclease/exonuclease/phosphatase family metal-dependent hydrolase
MSECAQTLCVATYNIHRGLGRDRRLDHDRITSIIVGLDADVVALQEVETPATVAREAVALLDQLGQQGYEPVLGPTIESDRGTYGNVLLSRLPVVWNRGHDLSQPGREPRGLIEARLGFDGCVAAGSAATRHREIYCFATHLGLRGLERRRQVERLVERIDESRPQGSLQSPAILLGDFNEWRRRSRRLRPIDERFEAAPLRPTYPSHWPLLPLDRIWFGGGLQLQKLDAVTSAAARIASDHLPLRASFTLAETT